MTTTNADSVPDSTSSNMDFLKLDAAALGQIRKTSEETPRLSVLDVIGAVTGVVNPRSVLQVFREAHPEAVADSYRFPGRGQQETLVGDAREIAEVVLLLPGTIAADFRKDSAKILVHFLGGDPSLVDELAAIHLSRGDVSDISPRASFRGQGGSLDDPPGAFFRGQGGSLDDPPGASFRESDRVKRAREELQFVETQGRIKRARVEGVRDVVVTTWAALAAIGLSPDDRDRARAGDMIRTAAFDAAIADVDPEICIRGVLSAAGHRGPSLDCKVGKLAKKLYMKAHPDFTFPKKNIYANGQLVEANIWKASQQKYVDTAIAELTQA